MSSNERGSFECPICGIAAPHEHTGHTGGPKVVVDTRVERLAHALGAAQQNRYPFPADDAAQAFRELSPLVRVAIWGGANTLLDELLAMGEAQRRASE